MTKEKEKSNLETFKQEYKKFRKKYALPEFKSLNEDFDIARISDIETETILRDIRKTIVDKILSYLRFLEMFLNPSQNQMFFFILIKSLEGADKKLIEELYGKLGKMEIEVIWLDNQYDEKKEAEFINKTYKEWQEIKKDMDKLIDSFKRSWKKKIGKKRENYFG